jgi:inner membrane protein YidH
MNQQSSVPADPRAGLARDRTGMAKFRTQLALDRTTLAWIRTTLTMATFGFGMIGYFRSLEEKTGTARSIQLHRGAIKFGVTLVSLSILATILSGMAHWFNLRRLRAGRDLAITQWPPSITVAMLLSLLGLGGLWYTLSH